MEKKPSRHFGDESPDRNDGRAGTISINFFSNEELNAFINKMMAEKNVSLWDERAEAGKSIDGIIENKSAESAPVGNELSAEKMISSGRHR